jgi:hypothetical protein
MRSALAILMLVACGSREVASVPPCEAPPSFADVDGWGPLHWGMSWDAAAAALAQAGYRTWTFECAPMSPCGGVPPQLQFQRGETQGFVHFAAGAVASIELYREHDAAALAALEDRFGAPDDRLAGKILRWQNSRSIAYAQVFEWGEEKEEYVAAPTATSSRQ